MMINTESRVMQITVHTIVAAVLILHHRQLADLPHRDLPLPLAGLVPVPVH